MKQWRVGTVSMGAALILFGSVLFVSQLKGKEVFTVLIDWWPIVVILLGIELLVYLGLSKAAQPSVKYDIFSIFFVGFLCFVCLGGAILSYTGLMQEVRYAIGAVERSDELADVTAPVTDSVKRIIVQNHNPYPIQVSKTSVMDVHVFGVYRYTDYADDSGLKPTDSVVSVKTIGDTMYVQINQPPTRTGINQGRSRLDVTVVVPEGLDMAFAGGYGMLN